MIETSQYWFVVRNVFKEGLLVIRASRIRARHNFVAHEQPSSHFPIFSNPWIVHLITWKCSLQVWQDTKQFNQENTAPLPWYLIRHSPDEDVFLNNRNLSVAEHCQKRLELILFDCLTKSIKLSVLISPTDSARKTSCSN